jgi:predicted DNA-binding protein (MmcQ/YjbR family)
MEQGVTGIQSDRPDRLAAVARALQMAGARNERRPAPELSRPLVDGVGRRGRVKKTAPDRWGGVWRMEGARLYLPPCWLSIKYSTMDKELVRAFCLALPGTTEQVQWGNDLLYKIGGKMYLVMNLEPAEITGLGFKCTPEDFAELTEREGIAPNKYLARAFWISVRDITALNRRELESLIRGSYEMVLAKLPKRVQREIEAGT